MNEIIGIAEACATTMRKTKKIKMNGDGGGFIQRVSSIVVEVWDRLGFLNTTTMSMRDHLVISNLLWLWPEEGTELQ